PRGLGIGRLDVDGEGAEPADEPGKAADLEEPVPGHVVDGLPDGNAHERWIGERHVIGCDEERAVLGNVSDTFEADAPVEPRAEPHRRPEYVEKGRVHATIVPRRP